MTRAMYPGTFDPFHLGHFDIASRASAIFDELIVAINDNPAKNPLFEPDERVEMAEAALGHLHNVSVITYRGLTVEFARQARVDVMVRGLRNVADYQFEHQIGWANRHMASNIELCCLFCSPEYAYISATIVKEVASLNGRYSGWVMPHVERALRTKFMQGPAESVHPDEDVPDESALDTAGNPSTSRDGKLAYHN
ncbi:MAG: pantetheine-phosphate adenylyltransferase [Caldilineaceae bacterium]